MVRYKRKKGRRKNKKKIKNRESLDKVESRGNVNLDTISIYEKSYRSVGYLNTGCSCFIIKTDSKNLVATASHCITSQNKAIAIFPLQTGHITISLTVKYNYPSHDFAVYEPLDSKNDKILQSLPGLELDSQYLDNKIGQPLIAIGGSLGVEPNSFSMMWIRENKWISNNWCNNGVLNILVDGFIFGGNSGGPLIKNTGKVVGQIQCGYEENGYSGGATSLSMQYLVKGQSKYLSSYGNKIALTNLDIVSYINYIASSNLHGIYVTSGTINPLGILAGDLITGIYKKNSNKPTSVGIMNNQSRILEEMWPRDKNDVIKVDIYRENMESIQNVSFQQISNLVKTGQIDSISYDKYSNVLKIDPMTTSLYNLAKSNNKKMGKVSIGLVVPKESEIIISSNPDATFYVSGSNFPLYISFYYKTGIYQETHYGKLKITGLSQNLDNEYYFKTPYLQEIKITLSKILENQSNLSLLDFITNKIHMDVNYDLYESLENLVLNKNSITRIYHTDTKQESNLNWEIDLLTQSAWKIDRSFNNKVYLHTLDVFYYNWESVPGGFYTRFLTVKTQDNLTNNQTHRQLSINIKKLKQSTSQKNSIN